MQTRIMQMSSRKHLFPLSCANDNSAQKSRIRCNDFIFFSEQNFSISRRIKSHPDVYLRVRSVSPRKECERRAIRQLDFSRDTPYTHPGMPPTSFAIGDGGDAHRETNEGEKKTAPPTTRNARVRSSRLRVESVVAGCRLYRAARHPAEAHVPPLRPVQSVAPRPSRESESRCVSLFPTRVPPTPRAAPVRSPTVSSPLFLSNLLPASLLCFDKRSLFTSRPRLAACRDCSEV